LSALTRFFAPAACLLTLPTSASARGDLQHICMSAVGLDEPPGVAAAAAADEDAEAASAADSISVAEEEPGGMELVTDGSNGMHQPTVNLDITDAAISQEIQPDVAPGGELLALLHCPPGSCADSLSSRGRRCAMHCS